LKCYLLFLKLIL